MELRDAARVAFLNHDVDEKVALALALPANAPLPFGLEGSSWVTRVAPKIQLQGLTYGRDDGWKLDEDRIFSTLITPGRPEQPILLTPDAMPKRKVGRLVGHAALIHAVCHIEFNAINLALDAIWRFAHLPPLYYWQWARVAVEEARHFSMLRRHLQALPLPTAMDYGDLPAHDGLWEMCVRTQDDCLARMALVPRTLEARGLDATPLIQTRLCQVQTPWAQDAVGLLDVLLHDEIGHVAIGNFWYAYLCHEKGVSPLDHYQVLVKKHRAPVLKPPFNEVARQAAGFSEEEMAQFLSPSSAS